MFDVKLLPDATVRMLKKSKLGSACMSGIKLRMKGMGL
ncbi:MAG: hypothetical protein ACJAQ4_002346 [Cryomorphaceae bacterium]|jgi:hypothetical protein